jgi:hypothetical protein
MNLEATDLDEINSTITLSITGKDFDHELRLRVEAVIEGIPVEIKTCNSMAENLAGYALCDLLHLIVNNKSPEEAFRGFRMLIDAVCDRAIQEREWKSSGVWAIMKIEERVDIIEEPYAYHGQRGDPPLPKVFCNGRLSFGYQTAQYTATRLLDHFSKSMWDLALLDFCAELLVQQAQATDDYFSKNLTHPIILRMLESKEVGFSDNYEILLAFITQVWWDSERWGGAGEPGVMDRLEHIKPGYQQRQQDMISGLSNMSDGYRVSRCRDDKVRCRSCLLSTALC